MHMMDTIALISGGKDSFLALLHAIKRGHRIVALANLHPPNPSPPVSTTTTLDRPSADVRASLDASALVGPEELDSFMYQTVGSHLLPLYATALNLPLYRRAILGTSQHQSLEYGALSQPLDETEDLLYLLQDVLRDFPDARAVSAGAILSTYQRTRIESVCGRLGLASLAYLWQRCQTSVLEEMIAVGLDARIVKVAALGLDQSWLWENVATRQRLESLQRLQQKWGVNVAGEGGEFETIVVEGPGWRGRIVVDEEERVVCADGGAYWVGIRGGRVLPREERGGGGEQKGWTEGLTEPEIWEPVFKEALEVLSSCLVPVPDAVPSKGSTEEASAPALLLPRLSKGEDASGGTVWINNISAPSDSGFLDIASEATAVFDRLSALVPDSSTIVSTVLLLRSMADFASVNAVYSKRFSFPLPPARVCVSPSFMPGDINILLSVSLCPSLSPSTSSLSSSLTSPRRGLHVQSRSHWAPANIGPYSQAIHAAGWLEVAGMIPLVPGSMEPLNAGATPQDLLAQSLLALQHIFRVLRAVGREDDNLVGGCAWVTSPAAVGPAVRTWQAVCGPKPCAVVLACALPRGVDVEWVGYAVDVEHKGEGPIVECVFCDTDEDGWVQRLVQAAKGGLATVYTRWTEGLVEAWEDCGGRGVRVVPATAVWDGSGKRWDVGMVARVDKTSNAAGKYTCE